MTKSDIPSLSSPPPNLYPLEWREKRNSGDLEPLGSHYCQNQKITETIFNFHYIGIFITYPGACEPPSHYYEHVTFRLSTEVSYPNPVLASECVQIKTVKPDLFSCQRIVFSHHGLKSPPLSVLLTSTLFYCMNCASPTPPNTQPLGGRALFHFGRVWYFLAQTSEMEMKPRE